MIIAEAKLLELEATTPPTAEVQDRVRQYLLVAQISLAELAARTHRGTNSLSLFMNDRYTGEKGVAMSDVRLRRALVDFMNAHPVEIATTTQGRLHETSNVKVMRQWFERCLARREMAGLYGPPGAQKTFVFTHLVAEHNRREISKNGHGTRAYHVYCSTSITPRQLLRKVCYEAALASSGAVDVLMSNLRYHLGRRRSLVIFDEAQHLSIPCLEIIREMNDCAPHCGVILAGSHELFATFNRRAAELEQWNSRIANFVALPGIERGEVIEIIQAELGDLNAKQIATLMENSLVVDGYSRARQKYYSARRLFRQIHEIQSSPRFTAPNPAASAQVADANQKESAA